MQHSSHSDRMISHSLRLYLPRCPLAIRISCTSTSNSSPREKSNPYLVQLSVTQRCNIFCFVNQAGLPLRAIARSPSVHVRVFTHRLSREDRVPEIWERDWQAEELDDPYHSKYKFMGQCDFSNTGNNNFTKCVPCIEKIKGIKYYVASYYKN